MKKIFAIVAAIALAALPVTIPSAVAQPVGSVVCEARSASALGWGNAWTRRAACERALYECSLRTPANEVCVVTRWTYVV